MHLNFPSLQSTASGSLASQAHSRGSLHLPLSLPMSLRDFLHFHPTSTSTSTSTSTLTFTYHLTTYCATLPLPPQSHLCPCPTTDYNHNRPVSRTLVLASLHLQDATSSTGLERALGLVPLSNSLALANENPSVGHHTLYRRIPGSWDVGRGRCKRAWGN